MRKRYAMVMNWCSKNSSPKKPTN